MGSRSRKKRDYQSMATKLQMLQEGEHYSHDGEPALKERTLFKNPDREESNVDMSKRVLQSLPITQRFQRDAHIDYSNPREELTKFTQGVDEILPFDQGALSIFRPYDFDARQQVGLVIKGRGSYMDEEGKYDVTMDNYKEKLQRRLGSVGGQQPDPQPTPSEKRELARASLMESTSAL